MHFVVIIFSLINLLSFNSHAPCDAPYIIEIPSHLDLSETSSFEISLKESGLSENQILHVDMPDHFTLSDTHGRQDVQGQVTNHEITFTNNDLLAKNVGLEIEQLQAGDWSGQLDIHIYIENTIPSNVLESGEELNALLKQYDPTSVIFTDSVTDLACIGDVSKAKDASINAYIDGTVIYISNNAEGKILSDTSLKNCFKDLHSLSGVDLSHLDTSGCEDMSHMFEDAISLTSINGIADLNTSNVRDLSYLFKGCESIASLNVSAFDTSNAENLESAFAYCSSLKNLKLASWDLSSCLDLSDLFCQCLSLTSTGDLSSWNISNVTDLSGVFDSCPKLRNVGSLSNWNTSNVTDLSRLFNNCSKLSSIGSIEGWDVSNVTSFSRTFANAASLSEIGDLSNWNVTSSCINLSYMFENSFVLEENEDLHLWDVSNVTDFSHMFKNNEVLKTIDLSGWNTSHMNDASQMFAYDQSSSLSKLETIYGIESFDTSSLITMSGIFYENQYLNADLSSWNTALLEDISYAFYGTYRFDVDKLKHWNVSSVSNMNEAFGDNAGSLIQSPIPDWYH